MKIDDGIVRSYLAGRPHLEYSNHWVYHSVIDGKYMFAEPPASRLDDVNYCYRQFLKICSNFTVRNADLTREIFGDAVAAMRDVQILLTVGIPQPYDAMMRIHESQQYAIFDIGNFCDYLADGDDINDTISNILTHELIHLFINEKYPGENFFYAEKLDYIAFHEGFAHLLSYKEDIAQYQPDETYKDRYETARIKLIAALDETDLRAQKQFLREANSGAYCDKFAAISSMLYLMKHIDCLKQIYEVGYRGFAGMVADYSWS